MIGMFFNKIGCICLLFLLSGFVFHAQTQHLDSLKKEFRQTKNPYKKIHLLSLIAEEVDIPEIKSYNDQLNAELEKNRGKIHSDTFYKYKSTYYNNMGFLNEYKGEIQAALKFYTQSLRLAEKIELEQQVAVCYQNLASIYDLQGDYQKALKYYYKSLHLKQKAGNKRGMAYSLNNIAYVHTLMKNYDSTAASYRKSAALFKELEDEENFSLVLNNIGFVFMEQEMLDSAKVYFHKTLEIRQKNDDKLGLIYSYINLSEIQFREQHVREAQVLAEKAYVLAKQYGNKVAQRNITNLLHEIYYKNGEPAKAYRTYMEHIKLRDKITNEENKSEMVRQQLKYENDKKIAQLEKEKAIQKALSDERSQRQLLVIIFGIFGFLLVCVFSYILYKRYKVSQSQNVQIAHQKEIIEHKQQEINDSINYAERIQKSFLAGMETFENTVSDFFVYFNPKDVVSGDFYWANRKGDKLFVCVADSTGHGIPGAFMSLLNISLLNEGLLSKEIEQPNLLLDFVRRILILGLKPDESGQGGKDGMDCVCIEIDLRSLRMRFAGANNPLWIIRNEELMSLKPDKMAVGRSPKEDVPFSLQEFQLQKGDSLYLFSDGYPDQFGGPKSKKFKYKALEELLLAHVSLPMADQKQIIESTFIAWKGDLEQTDDVCITGLKI